MTSRRIRAARRADVKRNYGETADFDMPEPLPVVPMTPEQERQPEPETESQPRS